MSERSNPAFLPSRSAPCRPGPSRSPHPDGTPLEHADLSIDGGMPQHGHGLPTEPQVTEDLGGGRYKVEGMKFNMPGWWTITLKVSGAAGTDSATFNLTL